MCGIVGCISDGDAASLCLEGLRRLEYRGYDSAGAAIVQDGAIKVLKDSGRIADINGRLKISSQRSDVAILHTRWATHGAPNRQNAHPHTDCRGRIAIAHNGIIENHAALRKALEAEGHTFSTETDSEVIAHLLEKFYSGSRDDPRPKPRGFLVAAMQEACSLLEGAYAIAAVAEGEECIVAARRGSPLVVGIGEGRMFVASDPAAFVGHADKMVFLDDNEIAEVRKGSYSITNARNEAVEKGTEALTMTLEQIEKGGFRHFMLKEIFEQPEALRNVLRGRLTGSGVKISVEGVLNAKRIILTACGTSWHSALIGKYLLEGISGVPAEVDYASEFRYRSPLVGSDDLVIAISQSGETADTLAAIREAKARGARTLGIVNVVGSSIAREVGSGIYLHAGPETGVASTKAFTAQVAALCLLALHIKQHKIGVFDSRIAKGLMELPDRLSETLNGSAGIASIEAVAREFANHRNFLYLGRGINFPVALEGALKLKEISYIHAEGYPAAEMKHGPIALIDRDMPVLFIATENGSFSKILSNMEEVRARGGRIIAVANEPAPEQLKRIAEHIIFVPKTIEELSPIVSVIPLQLLAYHIADLKGLDVDCPRNLAKAVSVE